MNKGFIITIFTAVLFFKVVMLLASQSDAFKKFPNKYFVETGSFIGDGIEKALEAGFVHVYSIEILEQFFNDCKKRFSKNRQVDLSLGDSRKLLYKVIKDIDGQITFWLDSHYCVGTTPKADKLSLILKELEQIKKHPIKKHTILINHAQSFGTEYFDFVTVDQIVEKILEINPKYKFFLVDGHSKNDIFVARLTKKNKSL